VKKIIFTISILTFLNLLLAQFPVQEMGSTILGVKANMGFRGQNITKAEVPSHEQIPSLTLGYAPYSLVLLELGLGADRFTVDEFNDGTEDREFNGDFGFSPSIGITFFSPYYVNGMLRGKAGLNTAYWNSSDNYGYTYYGGITDLYIGALFSGSPYLDLEGGFKLHIVDGAVKVPGNTGSDPSFSNSETKRIYISMTLKSPYEGVFANIGFEASPEMSNDWSNGPYEAGVNISVGMLLSWKERKMSEERPPIYFPDYPEVRKTSDKMAEDLE
jgi:hypothetical protein